MDQPVGQPADQPAGQPATTPAPVARPSRDREGAAETPLADARGSDAQPATTPAPTAAEKQFPCKQCGAKLNFDPGARAQKCPYCGFENPIPQSEEDIRELDYEAFLAAAAAEHEQHERLTVKCPTCAAESTLEENVVAAVCPFCGSSIVAGGASHKALKPEALLPFKVTRPQALQAFRQWINGLWFAPSELKRFAREDSRLTGIYVPYWTFDTDTTSFYRGERGEDYWATEVYTTTENGRAVTRTRQVRRTRWYPASGTVWKKFDDLLVLASRSLPQQYAAALEPWDLKNVVAYQDEFLSGFRAESYQVGLPEGFACAKEAMQEPIRRAICADIGGDHQRITAVKTAYDHITFKNLLLPVWLSAYRYRDRVFRFLVNGRTGEVQGERPYSWMKIAGLALGIVAAVAAVLLVLSHH